MYRLYVFSKPSGEGEFVVISDESIQAVMKKYQTGKVHGETTCDGHVEIKGDVSYFPCDRPLAQDSASRTRWVPSPPD